MINAWGQFAIFFLISFVASSLGSFITFFVLHKFFSKEKQTVDERLTDAIEAAYAKRERHITRKKV